MQNSAIEVNENSLRAFATEIQMELSGGEVSDDSAYSLPHIELAIIHEWGRLVKIEDDQNERRGVSPSSSRLKTFPCLKLEDADDMYCKYSNDSTRLKKVKLPKMIEFKKEPYITFVGRMDSGVKFMRSSNINSMRANAKILQMPQYFVQGDGIYVLLPRKYHLMCDVTVIGIPESPIDTNTELCHDIYMEEWNCPEYMKAEIKRQVHAVFGNMILTTAPNLDTKNNSAHGNETHNSRTP